MSSIVFNRTAALREILAPASVKTEVSEITTILAKQLADQDEDSPIGIPRKSEHEHIAKIIRATVKHLEDLGVPLEDAVGTAYDFYRPFRSTFKKASNPELDSLANLIKKFTALEHANRETSLNIKDLVRLICEARSRDEILQHGDKVLQFIESMQERLNTEADFAVNIAKETLAKAAELKLDPTPVFNAWIALVRHAERSGLDLSFFFAPEHDQFTPSDSTIHAYCAMQLVAKSSNPELDLKTLGLAICQAVSRASERTMSTEEALELISNRMLGPIREKLSIADLAKAIKQCGEIAFRIGNSIQSDRLDISSLLSETHDFFSSLGIVLTGRTNYISKNLISAYQIIASEAANTCRQGPQTQAIYGSPLVLAINTYLNKTAPNDFLVELRKLVVAVQLAATQLEGDLKLLVTILLSARFDDFNELKEVGCLMSAIPDPIKHKLGSSDNVSNLLCKAFEVASGFDTDKPDVLNFHALRLVTENFIWLADHCTPERLPKVLSSKNAGKLLLFGQA